MYNWLGKTSVQFAFRYLRGRDPHAQRDSRLAPVAAAALAAYLASREVPEG